MTDLSLQGSPSTAAPPGAGADAAAQQRANAGPAVQETISYISTSRGQQFYENLHGEVRESIPSSGLVLCTAEDFEQEALRKRRRQSQQEELEEEKAGIV